MNQAKFVALKKGTKKNNKNSKNPVKRDFNYVVNLVSQVSSLQRTYFRRLLGVGTVATNSSGYIAAQTMAASVSLSGYADFSSVAALYSQYRAVALKMTMMPFNVANDGAYTGGVPPFVCVAPFRGGLAPVTIAQYLESSEMKIVSGYKPVIMTTEYKGDNDAHLWSQTNAAIPATESFGIAIQGQQTVAGLVSTNIWYFLAEWIVEFRVAQ